MNEIDYQDLAQRVDKNVKNQKAATRWVFFGFNVVFFLLSLFITMSVFSQNAVLLTPEIREALDGAIAAPFAFWAMTILFNLMSALFDSGVFDKNLRATATTQALSEQLNETALQQMSEKSKRNSARLESDAVTINDEGELVPLDEEPQGRSASS